MQYLKNYFKDKKKLIIFILIILFILASGGILIVLHKKKPVVYDFYVDSRQFSSRDGTEGRPYETISEALEAVSKNDTSHRKVFVFNGRYKENVVLLENTQLYGESRDNTIIKGVDPYPKEISAETPGIQLSPAITMKNNSSLNNVTISGGNPGVTAEENAFIENCLVKNTGIQGINALAGNFQITIKNSEISENNQKGIYIQKDRHFFINNIKSHHNHGEGIDLRENISGIVSNNTIYSNEESGIEFEVGNSSIIISDNKIDGNIQDGIQAQYCSGISCSNPDSLKAGDIKIMNNTISYNWDNGLKCTNPSGAPLEGYYTANSFRESISMENNIFLGNRNVIDSRCRLKEIDNKMQNVIMRFISNLKSKV